MIKVHDNRRTSERQLDRIEVGKFFVLNDILYRRCWYEVETFECIAHEPDTLVCMRMEDGELVLWRAETWVEPISDKHVCITLED